MPQRYNNSHRTAFEAPNIFVFSTEAEMEAYGKTDETELVDKSVAILLGASAAYDQAPEVWTWDADSTASAGATVIKPTNITTGRWRKP
jgi:hypothetical protein